MSYQLEDLFDPNSEKPEGAAFGIIVRSAITRILVEKPHLVPNLIRMLARRAHELSFNTMYLDLGPNCEVKQYGMAQMPLSQNYAPVQSREHHLQFLSIIDNRAFRLSVFSNDDRKCALCKLFHTPDVARFSEIQHLIETRWIPYASFTVCFAERLRWHCISHLTMLKTLEAPVEIPEDVFALVIHKKMSLKGRTLVFMFHGKLNCIANEWESVTSAWLTMCFGRKAFVSGIDDTEPIAFKDFKELDAVLPKLQIFANAQLSLELLTALFQSEIAHSPLFIGGEEGV